ncbi:MAG: D-alanyl-D-alanine carboxypeptidase DacB precursor [Bacteroidetes bacterium ADurb.Bin217]|nr:MAG: D-alanyl-D-alanine carboxypeptidase DacB precursor [Bacteroidetes bacterium ADurb.Bin217]
MKFTRIIYALSLTTLTVLGYSQTSIQHKVETYCNTNPRLTHAHYAVSVKDVSKDSLIVAVNEKKSMTPASIVKLYTTSAAIQELQKDFTFKTVIGYTGTIQKGVLKGNLIIIGGGDPTLGSKFFPQTKFFVDSIVQALQREGIQSIDGLIVLDCSLYGKEAIPQSWVWEDFGKDYATGVYPISFYDNVFSITLQTGNVGDTAKITQVFPSEMSTTIQNNAIVGNDKSNEPAIQGNPEELTRTVTGLIPSNRNSYIVRGAMPSPPDAFGLEIKQALFRANMVKYNQEYVVKYEPFFKDGLDTVAILQSPNLELIVGITNYHSNNSYAEHLLKYMGYNKLQKGTFEAGTQVVQKHFSDLGILSPGAMLYDGSGLSRYNTTTATHMTEFLVKKYSQGADSSTFFRSLPISGKPSTLRSYDFPSYLIGKINAKTGSMNRVRNMAGYMTTKSGNRVAFCIMIQGFLDTDGDMKKTMIDILDTIYTSY